MEIIHNPVILFFVFGIFAGLIKSNLEIPQQIVKFLSLYLLMSIGLKGGLALNESGVTSEVVISMLIALGLAVFVPLLNYPFLKRYLNTFDAIAVAATFGSISAVTFVTANQYLTVNNVAHSDYMSAAMALMEAPAIIIAVLFAHRARTYSDVSKKALFKESFVEGANLLLLASLLIGVIAGPVGYQVMKPLTGDLFTGLLAFFLLDMGLQVAKNIPGIKHNNPVLLAYAIVAPLIHSLIALLTCVMFNVNIGNTVLLMVLAASASYIAVPAALRTAMPEANPVIYLGLSLGITFPFNIIIGIPLYFYVANLIL